MYYVSKRMELAVAHNLHLDYESKCQRFHVHNLIVTVYCCAETLNSSGMVVDFTNLKKEIHDYLDHGYLNELIPDMNPTAENLAKWICEKATNICDTGYCYKVDVQESEGNIATYTPERIKNE